MTVPGFFRWSRDCGERLFLKSNGRQFEITAFHGDQPFRSKGRQTRRSISQMRSVSSGMFASMYLSRKIRMRMLRFQPPRDTVFTCGGVTIIPL